MPVPPDGDRSRTNHTMGRPTRRNATDRPVTSGAEGAHARADVRLRSLREVYRGGPTSRNILVSAGLAVGVFLSMAALSVGIYAVIASRLPSVDSLAADATPFRSTRIYDRHGVLINETFDPDAGRRIPVGLDDVSPALVSATIATEDVNFYEHTGVDPIAILRALWYALRERRVVSGASTIPQQLAKRLYLTPERTLGRKLKEAVLATEISRRYDKDEILELYLNQIYYGNLAYGVEAAADTYFAKEPSELSLAEAALIAGLPQAPAFYDPYTNPDRAKSRQETVLGLMAEAGFISSEEARGAARQVLSYAPVTFDLEAPHFTLFVREQLEARFGPDALHTMGLEVTTTLDRDLQETAETVVRDHVAALRDRQRSAGNGALVALDPGTGEILALVGSADFDDEAIDGQVNMVLAPRQPGSTMKPLAYLAALQGEAAREPWTPGTLLADIRTEFPNGNNPPYVPRNYDREEHGLVTLRRALGNSLNIPAVATLDAIGVDTLVRIATRMGITTLDRDDLGLSLVLGAAEVPLLEMTGAFGVFARGGTYTPPVGILRVEGPDGQVLCGTDEGHDPCMAGPTGDRPQPEPGAVVAEPEDAFLITSMLSAPSARQPAFASAADVLSLADGRPAAVKTGTTDDYRDSLTIGYTPDLVTGVWVGNADRSPMDAIPGSVGAAPIWHRFMSESLRDEPVAAFPVPDGVAPFEVCADTGTLPSEACPETAGWYFRTSHPPLPAEQDLWQRIELLAGTDRLAPDGAPACMVDERDFKVYPGPFRAWALEHGIPQPPTEMAQLQVIEPDVEIRRPTDGAEVSSVFTVTGSAELTGFSQYSLWYGEGEEPRSFFGPLWGPVETSVDGGVLGRVDLGDVPDGPYVLRLIARDQCGTERDHRVRVEVVNPTPTPTPSPSPSPSATSTAGVTPTTTSQPTWTPEPTKVEGPGPTVTLAVRPTLGITAEPGPPIGTTEPTEPAAPTSAPEASPTLAPRPTLVP